MRLLLLPFLFAAAVAVVPSRIAEAATPSVVRVAAPGSATFSPATIRPFGAAWIAYHPQVQTIQPGFRGINLTTFGGFMHRIVGYDPATRTTTYASGYRVQTVP